MFCTGCGSKISDEAIICVHCSAPVVFFKGGKAYAVDILSLKPYNIKHNK